MKRTLIRASDYHVHSIFSDGLNTFDEIALTAEKLGRDLVAITDHSDEYMHHYNAPRLQGFLHALYRWRNSVSQVHIIRGMEIDLLSEDGAISDLSKYKDQLSFLILSAHAGVYQGDTKTITEAYLRAIDRHAHEINMLGHPCSTYFGAGWEEGINIEKVVAHANAAGIGLEINGANLVNNRTNPEKLKYVCENAILLYVNSDAHSLNEMAECHQAALDFAGSCGLPADSGNS